MMEIKFLDSKNMSDKLIFFFMDVAIRTGQMSHATRSKVGALIVKNGNILSFGYNGMPHGFDNTCEENNVTKQEVLHAESNCFAKLLKSGGVSTDGASMFVSLLPCTDCAKLIHQAGIKHVYFSEYYRIRDSIDFLKRCGINIYQVNNNQITKI